MSRTRTWGAVSLMALGGWLANSSAGVVTMLPAKDNTLIQRSDPEAQLSNGQGDLFVGRTNQDGQGPATVSIRRGLLAFDVAGNVPAGATITAVTLTVRDAMGLGGDQTTELRRTLQDWGEGASYFNGGQGAAARQGDATWLYRFYDEANPAASPAWSTPGGSFSSLVSASAILDDDGGGGQYFAWHGELDPQMIADVQQWLDDPQANFGWTLIGNEAAGQTAKRLNSRESAFPPRLEILYRTVPGDGNGDGCVTGADYTIWADHFGAGPGASESQGDYNGDGFVSGADFTVWADHFGDACAPPIAAPEPAGACLAAVAAGADYTIWADHFGSDGATLNQGDFNGDTLVTGADYTVWADHFGMCAATPAPEPAGIALALAAGLLAAWPARRRRIRPQGQIEADRTQA